MASPPPADIEELALCSCCRRAFDERERPPKLLACKHHFCLACARTVLAAGREVRCMHCWKRTEPPAGHAAALPTHGAVLALALRLRAPPPPPELVWCCACSAMAGRACAEHAAALRPTHEVRALFAADAHRLAADLQRLAARRRELQLRALDAATALKLRLEAELAAPAPAPTVPDPARSVPAAAAECDRLRALHADALLRCRLDDVVHSAVAPLDFETLRRALAGRDAPAASVPTASGGRRDPALLLANYCTAQMFARTLPERRETDEANSPATVSPATVSPSRAPAPHPLFYFELEMNGAACGRVVVEVRDDAAPRMARNFAALATGELGVGYRGCAVFQCWENESVITGDFELNDGRGGRAAFEEGRFAPDDTRLAAVRGAVGMRRSQRRHDAQGLVGSQFRIVLREMRGFSAIFAFVVEGLELVDRLSRQGDGAGKPHATILISDCGRLN